MKIFHFLQYHNAVPLALGVLFLGATASFAAANPDVLYSTAQTVLSVDNTYIAEKDLSTYTPKISISSVTEDDDAYYVAYTFTTIDVDDAVWKDLEKHNTLTVEKSVLAEHEDLGLYVTEQFKQLVSHEIERLKEVQTIERRNVSQKMVAVAYSGLVGAFLDGTTEVLPGYTPVVVAPAPAPSIVSTTGKSGAAMPAAPAPAQLSGVPIIQMLGNNPALLQKGDRYQDLGAIITGPTLADMNFGITIYLDGKKVGGDFSLDTSKGATYIVRYEAENDRGIGFAERTIVVNDPSTVTEPATSTEPVLDTATSTAEEATGE